MSGWPKSSTLFEAVPALGAISARGAGRARLLPVGFEHPGLELVEGVNRLGRDPGQSHHVILSSHVSRCHCEVLVGGGDVRVRDLGSHNGTWVNGQRVTEKELRPGDKLGLSRRVTLLLVMDSELQKPIGMDVDMEAAGAAGPPTSAPPSTAPEPSVSEAEVIDADEKEPDQAALIRQLEQQRDALAILYQISLRCLMAEDSREAEKLIANVLQRLLPLESGFILFPAGGGWRASICPGSRGRPSDETVQACYRLAVQRRAPLVIEDPAQLRSLGICAPGPRSAMVVPLMLDKEVRGVIGALASQPGLFTASLVDIVVQIANISAAALRQR